MYIEIDTISSLEEFFRNTQSDHIYHITIQGLDLRLYESTLLSTPLVSSFFLGCQMGVETMYRLSADGHIIFPHIPNLPYKPFRGSLYTALELLDGYEKNDHTSFLRNSYDGLIYQHHTQNKQHKQNNVVSSLLERIHDHAIDDALEQILNENDRKQRSIGIMGGHSCKRNTNTFREIAHLGYKLSKAGYFVVTGGGPGAMEAGNLGAYMSTYDIESLDEAINILSIADSYTHPAWFDTALTVLETWPSDAESLGVPTWFYGHEPSNLFAKYIAKYFANSIREDGILTICQGGIVFTPGSAGTIQEIFQDACQNHYASTGSISPMIFLNKEYWITEKPVYPLLEKLAFGKEYSKLFGIYDNTDDIIIHLAQHPAYTTNP